jgi:hypothetical protein
MTRATRTKGGEQLAGEIAQAEELDGFTRMRHGAPERQGVLDFVPCVMCKDEPTDAGLGHEKGAKEQHPLVLCAGGAQT